MSSSNKKAKEALIRLYGAECFIDKLGLRKDKERRYTGKGQYEKMKGLTFHHIEERCRGGKATVENGALLSLENHQWFNQQSRAEQARMNEAFQEHKREIDEKREKKECRVVLVDDLETGIEVKYTEIVFGDEKKREERQKFNRAREKREFRRRVEEELEYE